MRICSPQLGLSPNSILGGEVYDREILKGLAKKGINIEIILPKNLTHDNNVKNWNIAYFPFNHIPAVLFNLLVIPYLFILYKRRKFKIIRIHSPMYLGLGVLIFKFIFKNVKLIATFHQFRETTIFGLGRMINKKWDHIITDSYYVRKKIIKEYKIKPSNISAIHNGVPSYLKPAKKDRSLVKGLNLEGKIALLFLGLFIKRKNPLFLLKVLKNLREEKIVLVFWGDGPLKNEIIKSSKDFGLEKMVRIIDPIYGPKKSKIHNLADIFVHPAIDEGFALAPLEAMACAKPVIMNSSHSAKEAIEDGVNGLLCTLDDEAEWTDSLLRLIRKPELREKMGKESFSKVKREFQWSISVAKHLEIFKKTAK